MRTWLITGVSSGLGKALAEYVIERGDYVVATFRKAEQADAFDKKFKKKGKAHLLDITDAAALETMVHQVKQSRGSIDVLVNNAGFGMAGAVEETSMDEARRMFETNFFAALRLTILVLPLMRNNRNGHIFQISSHGGMKAFPGFGIYNASKFALEGMSEALAAEVASLGIRVTIVEPGPFRTGFAAEGFALAKDQLADYRDTAGTFRKNIKAIDGKQEGDPIKAANIIWEISTQDDPPLRLPLGKIALLTIQSKLDSVKRDLENTRALAESAVYD